MSLLIQVPNPEVFATVPDFTVAVKKFEDNKIEAAIANLGDIFVKHNAYDDFGLGMTHRHFDMNPNEVLVQIFNDAETRALSAPWVVEGNYAAPLEKDVFEVNGFPANCNKRFVIPINWCFGINAEIVPFEFWATDDTNLPEPKPEFVRDLYEALHELGVEQYVSLRRSADIKGKNGWETTPKGDRANIVEIGEMPVGVTKEEMIKVFWHFDNDGKLRQNTVNCNGHRQCKGHTIYE
jgi:hypothetical protein